MSETCQYCQEWREDCAKLMDEKASQQEHIDELEAHVERLLNASRCPNYGCNDGGCIHVRSVQDGEWELEQCEFCYCEPTSLFRARMETPAQSLDHIKREAMMRAAEICDCLTRQLAGTPFKADTRQAYRRCAEAIRKEAGVEL